jgi:ribosomal protein S18 acetylase RimI-like enzyme
LVDDGVLDNPAWHSLTTFHARFSEVLGKSARYQPQVAPFCGFSPDADGSVWEELATLAGPGETAVVVGSHVPFPDSWESVRLLEGVQMVDVGVDTQGYHDTRPLASTDVQRMLDLVKRTQPGPFLPRTIELGTYAGIWKDGILVAMAGERMHPPGWTEISGVCTDDAYRGMGLATTLIRAIAAGIRTRGDTPFLHVAAGNSDAIRLYESLGFVTRRRITFNVLRTPL